MIISQTPLRISFVGGGTDLPSFYEEHGGAVVSRTISRCIRRRRPVDRRNDGIHVVRTIFRERFRSGRTAEVEPAEAQVGLSAP